MGIAPLRPARALADQVELPLMVHIGKGPPALDEIFRLLRPGDILTHCCTGQDNRILEPDGSLKEFVRRAWDAGLVLDVGHGTGSFSFEVAERMLAAGMPPDVISTDAHQLSVQGPMFDLPTTLSKFLNLGMSLSDAIERATARPARAVRRPDLATLKPGAPADVAVFALEQGSYTFHDVFMTARPGTVRLVNTATVRARTAHGAAAGAAAGALGGASRASAREVGRRATIRVQLSRATRRTDGTSVRSVRQPFGSVDRADVCAREGRKHGEGERLGWGLREG